MRAGLQPPPGIRAAPQNNERPPHQGRGRGRGSQNVPPAAPPVPVPDAEFDFAQHNLKFDKKKLAQVRGPTRLLI